MANHPFITADDVRMFIMDRSVDDNDLLMDLAYDDKEISNAMVRAAREYNSIPPLCSFADPDTLDATTNMFLDAIATQLYLSTLNKLMRNDIDYNAGGVTTNIVAKRIGHLKELINLHQGRFTEAASSFKKAVNISQGFFHY